MDATISIDRDIETIYRSTRQVQNKRELLAALDDAIDLAEQRNSGSLFGCTISVVLE